MKPIYCLLFLFAPSLFFGQDYSVLFLPKHLSENSNSVVIEELIEVDVTKIAKMTTKKRRVVTVLNKLGNNKVELYEYYNPNSKVKKINASIYDASGKEIGRFKKRNFIDVGRTGTNMYADSRMLYLNYTPTSYPYTVVFESEVESGDTGFMKSWVPVNGYAESIQKSEFRIKFDPDNKPKYKTQNLEGYNITIEDNPDEIIFSAADLPAFKYEEHSPIGSKIFPVIRVALDKFYYKGIQGFAKDWKEFGSWMESDLLSDVRDLPESTLKKVRDLVAQETTNEGKARLIYQYVQEKVRYISIQIGIGGWKPMPATEVDNLSYGDCKALTNYTKTLLDAVGVPSYYTILYGHSQKWDIMEEFASLQGNHMILGIPDGDKITWLECTSQDTPYGYIGSFTGDRKALIITPEGGKIVHTQVYDATESTQENIARVRLDANGNVTAEFSSVSRGIQYEDKYPLLKKKVGEVDTYYKKRWGYINGFSIEDLKFRNDKQTIAFSEQMRMKIPGYAARIGNDYLFCPNIFNQSSYIPPRIEDRKQNLYLNNGYMDIDSILVEIPENFVIDALPEPTLVETKFGKYEIVFAETAENNLHYTRKIQIEKGEFPPSEYENYREFLRDIARLDKTRILIKQISK